MSMFEPAAPERIVNLPNLGFWTEEKIARAKALFADGWSYTQIGIELGTTRNAICGKLVRSKIYRVGPRVVGDRTYRARRPYKGKTKIALKPWETGAEATDLPPDQPDNPANFVELRDDQCRWPCSGEGIDTVFCGGDAIDKLPYCARHCRMAYMPLLRIKRAEFHAEAQRRKANHKAEAA